MDRNPPTPLPLSAIGLLRLFKKSTKFDSEFFSEHNGARIFLLDEGIPLPLPLSISHCLPRAFKASSFYKEGGRGGREGGVGSFMPIALDKVFKAR